MILNLTWIADCLPANPLKHFYLSLRINPYLFKNQESSIFIIHEYTLLRTLPYFLALIYPSKAGASLVLSLFFLSLWHCFSFSLELATPTCRLKHAMTSSGCIFGVAQWFAVELGSRFVWHHFIHLSHFNLLEGLFVWATLFLSLTGVWKICFFLQ